MGFVLPAKYCSEVFFAGLLFVFENNVGKTDSVFQAASLNGEQKKHCFVEQQTGRLFIVYSTES